MLNNYICALDIGSSKLAAAVARIKRRHITDIFFEAAPVRGVEGGTIIDSIDLISSIGRVLKNLKVKSGINIQFIYVSISGGDVVTKHSQAVIPLTERGNKVITSFDIQKVNEQALILGLSLDEEIIHSTPFSYAIDSSHNVLNPVGLYSHRLEVDLYLVCGKPSSLQSLERVVNQAGYEIKDLFLSGIATGRAVFNEGFKERMDPAARTSATQVDILCDIGSDITELLTFRGGVLGDIRILPLGGGDLTRALSDELKIPFDLAEEVKISYGSVGDYNRIKEDKEILIKKSNIYKPIKQKLISEIVTSKTGLICKAIRDAMEESVSSDKVNNFIATGRTVLLDGFLEALESGLGLPCKLGRIVNPDIISLVNKDNTLSGHKYLTYLTCLGIICEALRPRQQEVTSIPSPTRNPILKAINKVKEIYQEYF